MLRVALVVDEQMDLNLWAYTLLHWQPDEVYALGVMQPDLATLRPFRDVRLIADASELPRGHLVVMAPLNGREVVGEVSLADFAHPDDATYLFGPDAGWLELEDLGGREPDARVFIPTGSDDQLHAHVAAAVTLYDRAVKRG
jgi:hypothetical protein